ncbi:hypothetical protein SBOR_7595 [Sclerotinia borealis F-4128]|uniref:Uncharacterized protein n=1 Tax=Sclerotinia borealis (strain F-4128) TaxID=1432307 RepID=W9CAZ1_SCLBF|nr:hypothetical protein SBOR_7595 [Sclerotinia borealis F-4128]
MPSLGNFWRHDNNNNNNNNQASKKKRTKKPQPPRPPPKIIHTRETLHPVFHAPGVYVSPQHHFSTHVYLIFHLYNRNTSGKFVATVSFRTMYNDFKGMKTLDISPCSEEADAQFDINGGEPNAVLGGKNMLMVKIGWVQRNEKREEIYARVAECLPFPVRADTMDSEEWEEVRAKGMNPRCEWVVKAIGVLRKAENWESLPVSQFRERHDEVKKLARNGDSDDEKRKWKRRVDRATRHFEDSGDAREYREKLKELGSEPESSSEAIQARYLDKLMNDVGAALYSKDEEEPKKISYRNRRRNE